MTLCIASACDDGQFIVTACDSALTYGTHLADMGAAKWQIFGEWCFMFAGELGTTEMIVENIRHAEIRNSEALTRENVCLTVKAAYEKHAEDWCTHRHLARTGMDMVTFIEKGRQWLGDSCFGKIKDEMDQDFQYNFSAEVLVVGWGKEKHAAMIYRIDKFGEALCSKDGMAIIGSGGDAAMTMLFMLGAGLRSSIADSIYAVAAAKFSSEQHGIGKETSILIGKKGKEWAQLSGDKISALRQNWETHGKPQIPAEAREMLVRICLDLKDERVDRRMGIEQMMAAIQKPRSS